MICIKNPLCFILILIFAVILIPNAASGKMQCTVCSPGSCPSGGTSINIFNISEDGSIWTRNEKSLTNGKEVWCSDTDLTSGTSTGTPIVRISDMADAHAQRTDYPGLVYSYNINISSEDVNTQIGCGYLTGNCGGYDTCVFSMESSTNAHVGGCNKYDIKVCCNAGPITPLPPPPPEEKLVKFVEHSVFISIGENRHAEVQVRNIKPAPDTITLSLDGTYPTDLVKFLPSSSATLSGDRKVMSFGLGPNGQKTVYAEIVSTDVGDYTLNVTAVSSSLTDRDSMGINIGFPAAFPGIEIVSALIIVMLSSLIYWKVS